MKNYLENATKLFAISTSIFVLYGFVFNLNYYSYFNIDITSYIDLSESLILFLPQIGLLSFISIYFLFTLFMTFQPFYWHDIKKEISQVQRFHEYPKFRKKYIVWILIGNFILLILYLLNLYTGNQQKQRIVIVFSGLLNSMFTLPIVIEYISQLIEFAYKIKIKILLKEVLFISLLLLFSVFFTSNSKFQKVMKERKQNVFSLQMRDGSLITSDSVNVFVGRTKNYFFIYNKLMKETKILSNSDIKQYSFKN